LLEDPKYMNQDPQVNSENGFNQAGKMTDRLPNKNVFCALIAFSSGEVTFRMVLRLVRALFMLQIGLYPTSGNTGEADHYDVGHQA
jgi:hypothetical protein